MEAARALQQEEIIEWLIPDMVQGMRVEHDRLAQLAHHRTPVQNLRCLTCKANRRHKPPLRRAKVIDTWASRSTANPRFSR